MLPTKRLPITLKSPMPDSQPLLVRWVIGQEELGRLFEYEVELETEANDVPVNALLGKAATVCVSKMGGVRFINGIVTRLVRLGSDNRSLSFRALLSPKLWLLTRTRDCRIYQNKTVPDVVKDVLREHAITFSERLSGEYRKWDYLTQYRESDFAFVSRILEQEGIYYYFKHSLDDHELVLSDSVGSHETVEGYDRVPVRQVGAAAIEGDHISEWRSINVVASARVVLQDHDFRLRRGADIAAVKAVTAEHEQDELEVYDYPGEYVVGENSEEPDARATRTAGEHYALARLDEQRSDFERVQGEGNARGLEVGALLGIDSADSADKQYLVVLTHHELRNPETQSGGLADPEVCRVSFSLLDSKRQFRPTRTTDKPVIAGPQTAVVVGKAGEEIWTDKFGRVKVQFHWEREPKMNETSSCWIRVGQMWAGASWGTIHIPRIGQEVIVQFLEGDPDRPIIVGSVYNADNMPPYALPANQTQSGIKSRSSKGGSAGNFNEIRFEDKKGAEQLYIQAEKNQENLVKADASLTVGGSRTKSVGTDETVSVGANRTETVTQDESVTIGQSQTLSVGVDRTKTVGANQTETVGVNRRTTVGGNETLSVGGNASETVAVAKTLTVGAVFAVSVGGAMNTAVGAALAEEVGAAKAVTVGGLSSETVGASKSVTAGKDINETAGGNVGITAAKNVQVTAKGDLLAKAGKKGTIDAGDQLTLKCGDATIVLKKNGDIVINGKKISVKASGDLMLKGSKISEN